MNFNQSSNKLKIKSGFSKKAIDKDFSMWPHSHNYLEIMKVESGTLILDIFEGKKLKTSINVNSNSLIIITSNVFHRIRPNKDAILSNLEFEITTSKNDIFIQNISYIKSSQEWTSIFKSKYGVCILMDTTSVSKTIESIINRIQKVGLITEDIYIDALLMQMLIKISECYKKSKDYLDAGTYHFNKALDIIRLNLGNDINVLDIANELGLSVSYLERIFKDITNSTIKKYIYITKMELIRDELTNSNESLEKIFKKYGFSSMAQFVYQFKQIYGITPRKYREKNPSNSINEFHSEYSEISFYFEE